MSPGKFTSYKESERYRNVHCRRTAYRLSVEGVFHFDVACIERSSDHMVNWGLGVSLCRDETFFDGNNRDTVYRTIFFVVGPIFLTLMLSH